MWAIRVRAPGGPEVLRLEEVPEPVPGPGEALVQLEAIGVNFIDVYHRTGAYPMPLPFTPGMEGAGVVEGLGPGAAGPVVGTRVAWAMTPGAYATRALVPADRLVEVPAVLGARLAAAAMLQGLTAHYLATSTFPLAPGNTAVVHAAAGGVGLLLVQIAKLRGARVVGVVSSEEKAALALKAGAERVAVVPRDDFVEVARATTGGRGADVVYDSVGRDTFERSLDALAPRGTLVLFGQSSGAVPPIDLQLLARKGSLYVTRPTLAHYAATREELLARAGEVLGWAADGLLRLRIGGEWPLAEAAEAHSALESRRTTGKLLLIP